MSWNARRQRRSDRHLCGCGHRALYLRPGGRGVAFRRDHPLCGMCFGRLLDHELAEQLARRRAARLLLPPLVLEAA